MKKEHYGTTAEGEAVAAYTLATAAGMRVSILTYGCIIARLDVPDREGRRANVVLGLDTLEGYATRSPHFGAIAGRYANRIARGRFTLDGETYQLDINEGRNTLHGGHRSFHKLVWKGEAGEGETLILRHLSPDGDQGFPGNLAVEVRHTLAATNELRIDYAATTDKPTILNLTNHSYFNLAGAASGNILGHELSLQAEKYTPVDDTLIPTGELSPVKGTMLDFTAPKTIGARIDQLPAKIGGYDHNFVLKNGGNELALAAQVYEPKSGRVMEMFTTEPGVQFYTSNFLDGSLKGKGGATYQKHQAFCLEAQHYPDSVNQASFPSAILRPSETYKQTTVYKFSVK